MAVFHWHFSCVANRAARSKAQAAVGPPLINPQPSLAPSWAPNPAGLATPCTSTQPPSSTNNQVSSGAAWESGPDELAAFDQADGFGPALSSMDATWPLLCPSGRDGAVTPTSRSMAAYWAELFSLDLDNLGAAT